MRPLPVLGGMQRESGTFFTHTITSNISKSYVWMIIAYVLNVMPLAIYECKICVNEFYVYLCSATFTHRHCKRAGQRIIESIGSSIIIRSYILDMCECSNVGLYRAAFFINSSNRYTQMKQTIQATSVNTPVSVKVGTILSWHTAARVLNALPLGICECKTIEDAKGYVKALTIILSMFLLAAIEKGGTL